MGRDPIQLLAAPFHPDTPNDVAPRGFNQPEVPEGSPLELREGEDENLDENARPG